MLAPPSMALQKNGNPPHPRGGRGAFPGLSHDRGSRVLRARSGREATRGGPRGCRAAAPRRVGRNEASFLLSISRARLSIAEQVKIASGPKKSRAPAQVAIAPVSGGDMSEGGAEKKDRKAYERRAPLLRRPL